ncbi:hypothetical protein D3C76_1326300 [compost metagenome]
MGFDVGNLRPLGTANAVQGADLVMQQVADFLGAAGHGAAAEASQVLVGGVGADAHLAGHGQGHGLAHDAGVAGVEAAGDVGAINIGHDLGVQAHGPAAKTFTHIAIQ